MSGNPKLRCSHSFRLQPQHAICPPCVTCDLAITNITIVNWSIQSLSILRSDAYVIQACHCNRNSNHNLQLGKTASPCDLGIIGGYTTILSSLRFPLRREKLKNFQCHQCFQYLRTINYYFSKLVTQSAMKNPCMDLKRSDRSVSKVPTEMLLNKCLRKSGKSAVQLCTKIADCVDMSGVYTCSLSLQTLGEKTDQSTRIFQNTGKIIKLKIKWTQHQICQFLEKFS